MRQLIEPSHLEFCCLQKHIIIACGSERNNEKFSVLFVICGKNYHLDKQCRIRPDDFLLGSSLLALNIRTVTLDTS